ncbi:hypothetical protein HLH34_17995 [Gluconacetobacter azotocaptans]|uniref:Lipoprotein n=1 Tax=Gluconacetobacter azotocaptans TaxID=142834 RepID=A0A7W4JW19_9PROT|nr:hypothetical protein [Gluconacetobacter azotocaptans]MBB2191827.1 hypothetical protein [Gluconacetobacter azotocaptans]MBM9403742.1 hypothetical protein [Gluconacetobacter azotocaptans]GBQ28219.1 hypothetical protein AA13594_0908 [Gluconacetobacter azotocaptans DSM 13594]
MRASTPIMLTIGVLLVLGGCAPREPASQKAAQHNMALHNSYGFDDYGDRTANPPGLGGPH